MNKNWKKMPLKKRITEIRKRAEQEPEAIISEEEVEKFNNLLQVWRTMLPKDPFLMKITPLRYGAVTLDLYLRISLIGELLTTCTTKS